MNWSFVEKLNVNKIILNVLIVLFAYSISGAVLKILSEGTLGSIFRHLAFTLPYLLLIIIVSIYDVGRFSFMSLVPTFPTNFNLLLIIKRYLWVLPLALIIGWISANNIVHLGLLYVFVIIFLIGALINACYCMVNKTELVGIISFLMVIPFFEFISINSEQIGIKQIEIGQVLDEIYTFPYSAIFLLIVAGFFFLANYKDKINTITKKERNFMWLGFIFILSPIFSILSSNQPMFSFIYYFIALLLPFIYFLILIKTIKTHEDLSTMLFYLVLSGTIYTFFALYWRYKSGGIINITIGARAMTGGYSVFFLNPVVLPLLLPLQMGLYKILKGWKKPLILFSIGFNLLYLILVNHRGSQASIIVLVLIMFIFFSRINVIKKLYIVSIITISLIVLTVNFKDYLLEKTEFLRMVQAIELISVGATLDVVSTNRISIWSGSLKLASDYPFFGIGPGMYLEYMPKYSQTRYYKRNIRGDLVRFFQAGPHNLYLEVWLNYGLIALILYLLILYKTVKRGIWNIKNSLSKINRVLSLSCFGSLLVWIFLSFFTLEFFQFQSLVPIIFWTTVAAIIKLNVYNSSANKTDGYSPI